MDGDQKTTAPVNGRHYNPADIPPSLTEPTQLPQPTAQVPIERPVAPAAPPQPVDPPATTNSPAATMPDGGFYHPASDGAGVNAASSPAASSSGYESMQNRQASQEQEVSWVSSGDALQSRAASWRLKMTLIAVVMGVLVYIVTRDVVSSGAVAFAGLLFGFLGARKPPALSYRLGPGGIMVGQRYYAYGEFRAFSVFEETVSLVPLKRFSPLLSLHLDYQQHDQIIQVLSTHLPMESRKRDAMDMIIAKVKF